MSVPQFPLILDFLQGLHTAPQMPHFQLKLRDTLRYVVYLVSGFVVFLFTVVQRRSNIPVLIQDRGP